MDRDAVLECLGRKPGAAEEYPFGDGAAVFKVGGKMFALVHLGDEPGSLNLKCDPGWAEELRTIYPDAIRPGYHMNKRHWNTVALDGTVPAEEILELVEHSYELVVAGLPRRVREGLQA